MISTAAFRDILLRLGTDPKPLSADLADAMLADADPDDTGMIPYDKWARELYETAHKLMRDGKTPAAARKAMVEAASEKAAAKKPKK